MAEIKKIIQYPVPHKIYLFAMADNYHRDRSFHETYPLVGVKQDATWLHL